MSHYETIMSVLSPETLTTFSIAIFMIFMGINEDVDSKHFEKKNTLTLFFLLFILLLFDNKLLGISMFIGFWYASGITYLQSLKLNLEKDLNIFQLFHYVTQYWIFKTKNYILIICLLTILLLNYFFKLKYNIVFTALVILIFFLIYNLQNTRDNFGIKKWDEVKHKIYISSSKGVIKNEIEQLSFLYFMEDKNLFKRKSFTYSIIDVIDSIKNKKDILNKNENTQKLWLIQFVHKKIIYRLKRYYRGYSTIEQQVTRSVFLKPNSYQYKIRRKLFIERTLNRSFANAWCKAKSREYKKKDVRNAKQKLRTSLKYHYLRFYYIDILGSPQDKDEMIEEMAKHSRLSVNSYNNIYDKYYYNYKNEFERELDSILENEKKYNIINIVNNNKNKGLQ